MAVKGANPAFQIRSWPFETAIDETHGLTLTVEKLAMHRIRITGLPALLLGVAACGSDGPTEPEIGLPDDPPASAISDAVHQAGVPQFYWLPPTVPNPGPR
jgi:hypothetical protein